MEKFEANGRWVEYVEAFRALREGFGEECWFVEGSGFL